MNKPFLLLLGAFAIAGGWALVSGDSKASAPRDAAAAGPIVLGVMSSHPEPVMNLEALPAPAALPASAASTPVAAVAIVPAAVSMAEAREHGDDRAPPIEATSPEQAAPAPTPWELADEKRYQAYEQREQQRVRAAYLKAADETLPQWRAATEEARSRGLPAEDIAQAEEKVKRLEAMRAELLKRENNGGR